MMKDERELWAYLREQLQAHPELQQRSLNVGGGTGQWCFACDEPISAEHSVTTSRYHCPSVSGQIHWFHQSCEAILEAARHPTGTDLVEETRRRDLSRGR
jgi:hypothetical protein